MTKISISEAARLTGKPRSTLHRHIGNGTLSKESDGQGKPVLDLAEIERVYGPLLQADMKQNGAMRHPATSDTVAANRAEIEGLRRENSLLYSQLEDAKQQRQKWQQEADSWRQQATALLTDQRPKLAPEPEQNRKGLRGFLQRLTG
jgi:FtsZ-binding cell division protein ZapB